MQHQTENRGLVLDLPVKWHIKTKLWMTFALSSSINSYTFTSHILHFLIKYKLGKYTKNIYQAYVVFHCSYLKLDKGLIIQVKRKIKSLLLHFLCFLIFNDMKTNNTKFVKVFSQMLWTGISVNSQRYDMLVEFDGYLYGISFCYVWWL